MCVYVRCIYRGGEPFSSQVPNFFAIKGVKIVHVPVLSLNQNTLIVIYYIYV